MTRAGGIVVAGLLSLTGCGTMVPNNQENPFATETERDAFVRAILRNIRCELQDAVVRLYADNPSSKDPQNRNLAWFDGWAAQMSVTLTTDEKTEINPTGTWLPSAIFNLGAGLDASSEAQRVDKIGAFFLISELKGLKYCSPADRNTGPFIQSDLKLYDWLKPTFISMNLGDFPVPGNKSGPQGSNVVSHEVKFVIHTAASATPMWILKRATVDKGGTLFSTTRDRTQDMTITFGPPDTQNWVEYVIDPVTHQQVVDPVTKQPLTRPTTLAPAANNAALSSEISLGITNGLQQLKQP